MSAIKYRQDASSPWQQLAVIQGETGPQGPKGDKGNTGARGPKGDKGDKGEKGDAYTITAADYDAIADVVLTKLPSTAEVSY